MTIPQRWLLPVLTAAILALPSLAPAQAIRSAAGPNPTDIQASVDIFRLDLGVLNPNLPGSFGSGRREINWDGVPDAAAAPNTLPANFFNANSPRGVVFTTPGTGFEVSANSGVAPVQFGDINPTYPQLFEPFSAQRLFTPLGSNIVDVTFFVPGSSTPALTKGFGSIFSDVDFANTSSIQFFDGLNNSLGTFVVPSTSGDQTFSFLGVSFISPVVSRVRITNGNQALSAANTEGDLVVMDDFIYGEPIAAPVPDAANTALLFGLGLAGLFVVQLCLARRRKLLEAH